MIAEIIAVLFTTLYTVFSTSSCPLEMLIPETDVIGQKISKIWASVGQRRYRHEFVTK